MCFFLGNKNGSFLSKELRYAIGLSHSMLFIILLFVSCVFFFFSSFFYLKMFSKCRHRMCSTHNFFLLLVFGFVGKRKKKRGVFFFLMNCTEVTLSNAVHFL